MKYTIKVNILLTDIVTMNFMRHILLKLFKQNGIRIKIKHQIYGSKNNMNQNQSITMPNYKLLLKVKIQKTTNRILFSYLTSTYNVL